MIRSLTKFSIRENFYHSRATLVRWDRYYMVLEVYKLYTAVSHAMAWHAWHGIRTKPTVRSWWPPSCFTWCPSAPSQAVYTDLGPFYDDVATSPKWYRAPAELAKNQSSALASKLDQTRTRHVAVRCAGRHQPGGDLPHLAPRTHCRRS